MKRIKIIFSTVAVIIAGSVAFATNVNRKFDLLTVRVANPIVFGDCRDVGTCTYILTTTSICKTAGGITLFERNSASSCATIPAKGAYHPL